MNTTTTFADLGLAPVILKSLAEKGYEHPTPVQAQAIPAALAGTDLLVSSQTGSGKTAAFMLPCLTRLEKPAPQSNPNRLLGAFGIPFGHARHFFHRRRGFLE